MMQRSDIPVKHSTARFRNAASTYDRQPGVQPLVARKVADLIAASKCLNGLAQPRILEIGCGTGSLTAILAERYPAARILAVDIADGMIKEAGKRLGHLQNVEWRAMDVQHLNLPGQSFALITSSSALHWMRPLQPALQRLTSHLQKSGAFICGLMARGTLGELHALRKEIAPGKNLRAELPDRDQIVDALLGCRLDIEKIQETEIVARYNSAADFLKTLNRQGVTGGIYAPEPSLNRNELTKLIREYAHRYPHAEGGVKATYKVVFIHSQLTG